MNRSRPSGGEDPLVSDCIGIALAVLMAYLAATMVPLAIWSVSTHAAVPLAAHLFAMVAAGLARRGKLTQVVRAWTPLVLGPFLYVELRWLILAAGLPHHDPLVGRWESMLFPSNPSRTLALAFPSRALSEVLHAAYASYYLLIYVPPAMLWLRGRRQDYARTVLALAIVYAACFVVYIVFPVDGPRFLYGPADAPDGPIRHFVTSLLASGSSRGTAFPSSHVAASVVASICALRSQRPMGLLVSILTAGVAVGAVYGGYHYGVDIVAGAATGAGAIGVSLLIEKRMRVLNL